MGLAFSSGLTAYGAAMDGGAHLILRIETEKPVELGEFVATFVGLGNQFETFYDGLHPDDRGSVRFYVREVRAGSIIAELVPYAFAASPVLGEVMAVVSYANDLHDFVANFGGRLSRYFKRDGRSPDVNKADLADFLRTVQAVAHDSDAQLSLAAFDGSDQRIAFQFTTPEAREAEHNINEHRAEMERKTDAEHERVLMIFTTTKRAHARAGKRTGERVKIETISPRELPIVYASTLAEERIRHEIADADDNVYKKGFDVDVNVEVAGGRPIAYRVVAVHDVIDLPDD